MTHELGPMPEPRAWWRLSVFPECDPCVTTDPDVAQDWRDAGQTVVELVAAAQVAAVVAKEREKSVARIAELTDALRHVLEFQSAPEGPTIHNWGRWRRIADGATVESIPIKRDPRTGSPMRA